MNLAKLLIDYKELNKKTVFDKYYIPNKEVLTFSKNLILEVDFGKQS